MAGGDGSMRSGGPRVARRRHDRLVQQERRRLEQQQQQHGLHSPPYQQQHHHQQQGESSIEVGYHSDAYTMTSSTINSGAGGGGTASASATMLRSPASSTRTTTTSSSNNSSRRLTAARQNMMQRRIEARRRHEERQREQIMLQQSQPHQMQVTTGQQQEHKQQRIIKEQPQQYHAHPSNNMAQYPASDVGSHQHRYDQSQASDPDHGQPPHPQQPRHDPYPNSQNDPHTQQSHQHHHSEGKWQHQHFQSQFHHPNNNNNNNNIVNIPSPPMVQRSQEPVTMQQQQHQQQQQQQGGCSPSYDSYNMPVPITMEKNTNNNNPSQMFHYQVYNSKELERSGIIRNVGSAAMSGAIRGPSSLPMHLHPPPPQHRASQQQYYQQSMQPPPQPPSNAAVAAAATAMSATNRLRSSYESPSDEWHPDGVGVGGGYHHSGMNTNKRVNNLSGGNGGQQHQHHQEMYHEPSHLVGRNQHSRQQQPQTQSCSQAQQRQQIGYNMHTTVDDPMTNAGNRSVLKISSPRHDEQSTQQQQQQQHPPLQSQSQSQQSNNPQLQLPQLHIPPLHHPQPNWNDVNQLSRDDNRQRLYQRHLASRQKHQQQQQQRRQEDGHYHEHSDEIPSQQQHNFQQQHAHTQQQPQQHQQTSEDMARQITTSRASSPRLSTLSPVEHLGNRTDHIQRKNKFVLPKTLVTASTSASSLLGNTNIRRQNGGGGGGGGVVPSNNDICGASSVVSEQARKFEEAALKQQQHLSRQRRIEQRRMIEDRWMNRRKDNSSTADGGGGSGSRRGGRGYISSSRSQQPQYLNESHGYHSDGGSLHQQLQGSGGYQSDDQSIGSGRYHESGYRSEGGGGRRNYPRDEFQSRGGGGNYVDSDAITPQDARRRLWDENERLRVVLPRHEIQRDNGYDTSGGGRSPELLQHAGFASPGNHSGSSSAGGGGGTRFKSKFVHAAALAAQHEWQHSQMSQGVQHGGMESGGEHQHQEHQQQQHHLRDYIHTKKNSTVVSHYTDSTAETTADITTIPGGSYGSSRNNSSRITYSNDGSAHRISLSPPRHLYKADGHVGMPSIDEQGATASLPLPEESQNTLSVADLIARINAVSRSNPEQALAAIDSIIKRESVGGGGVDRLKNVMRSTGTVPGKSATMVAQEFAPNRKHVITPQSNEENNRGTASGEVRHLGKDFFRENYEHVLLSDSDKVIHSTTDAPGSRGDEDHEENEDDDDDDDDDSLLSSDESTVSSMTDPTYQSVKHKSTAPKNAPTSISTKERSSDYRSRQSKHQKEDYPLLKPQKSWNTLKREYTVRKLSPTEHEDSNTPSKNPSASNEEIKFSPDIEPRDDTDHQEQRVNHEMTIAKLEANSAVNKATKAHSTIAPNGDLLGNARTERGSDKPRGRGGTSSKQGDNAVTQRRSNSDEKKNTNALPTHQSQRNQSSKGNAQPIPSKTPEVTRANKPEMRPDTPDLMMAVTSAFANVDISFGGAKSTPNPTTSAAAYRPPDRPMPALMPPLISPESDDGEKTHKSFQTISDAFSDVDINFEQEKKTVSQRRKELEYYSKSWTTSKSSSYDSGDDRLPTNTVKHPSKTSTAAATWAKSSLSKSRGNSAKEKKTVEPTLRLKGNKSLAQKFASLVKAFDD